MQQVQYVRLAWRVRIFPMQSWTYSLYNILLELKSFCNTLSYNFVLKTESLYKLYKTILNVFSFVQWNKYFHEVKDEMFHSTLLRLVELNISSSPHENICTIALINIQYLYTIPEFQMYLTSWFGIKPLLINTS